MDLKEFYRTNIMSSNEIWPLNRDLAKVIMSYKPASVFEFGAGVGKHAQLLPAVDYRGLDINPQAVERARALGRNVQAGDESELAKTPPADVAFTCSVLNHIPDISAIVPALARIARRAVVIAETQDAPPTSARSRHFSHDYELYHFKPLPYSWTSFYHSLKYRMWVLEH